MDDKELSAVIAEIREMERCFHILSGKTDKANIWNVNTEKEYSEIHAQSAADDSRGK